ncbi:MAG: EAL domain-containing protein [Firmicutes bacterium]|nr:EAL domain-containing protein [Bacillota bacterium]
MEYAPLVFSLLFFIAFAVYLFFGMYIIQMDPKANTNRLFLLVCVSLCLWSFGFCFANSAPNLGVCMFWRRVSALGWGSIYSFLLHFVILLTAGKNPPKRRYLYFLLYIPAAVAVYAFSISNKITATQFNFVKIDYGWTNNVVQNGWTLFFNIYYMGFMLVCLLLIWLWKRKTTDETIQKQGNLIFYSILAALLLGSLTDVILSSKPLSSWPQMAPVFNLLPIAAIYYSMKHYNLMRKKSESEAVLILSEENRTRLHYYLAAIFLLGGLLSFSSRYVPHLTSNKETFKAILYSSALLFTMGLATLAILMIKAEKIKNALVVAMILLSIPLVTLKFTDVAAKTVWVFPIALMVVALIFNTRVPLILVALTAIITQIMVWNSKPAGAVQIAGFDFVIRIGLFIIILWVGLNVNKIYRKRLKEIKYMAYYDYLTGLPNRFLFLDRLNQAIYLAERTEKFIGVIFLDLDNFKMINDTIGHGGGDIILKEVAQGLVQHLRKTDTVARFGGDEFLIMLNNISNSENISTITANVMELFDEPFHLNGQEFFITCSAGIAVYPFDGEDAETLLKNADIAMYKAKSQNINQFILCTTDLKDEMEKNLRLTNNLYRAKERNELLIYYQPQIRISTGQITGLEALLRWKHPEMGLILPGVFVPLAERNGLINSIGAWVLETAGRQNKIWQDMGLPPLRVAVNLSAIQFNNPRIVDTVDNVLRKTGLDPKYLELEITESIAIKETGSTVDILNKLKNLGVSISIDDFGTAYSSLSRLKMLPIDRIKIDMQFIQGIESSEKDRAITKIIINLAKSLKLGVLAEGVETAPQLEFLNRKMCDEVQGFYYYKPMPAEKIENLLRSALKTS